VHAPSRLQALLAALVIATGAAAQQEAPPNGLFLVAKPSLVDPNFRRTVVLVTQTADASTVGVIVNRPTKLKLAQFLPEEPSVANYKDAIYFGGPVMREVLVAVFRSETTPAAAAFHVLKGVYLTMHPLNIQPLIADPARSYRLYAGFSGWAPRQLESELERDSWYLLPADAESVFSKDTATLWEELIKKATKPRPQARWKEKAPHEAGRRNEKAPHEAGRRNEKAPHEAGPWGPESPGGAARAALVATWPMATPGTRWDAASFCAAHELARYPDVRPESRFARPGVAGRGCVLQLAN
jgi:putative transcriptional regulator